jgi:hypothetical protein
MPCFASKNTIAAAPGSGAGQASTLYSLASTALTNAGFRLIWSGTASSVWRHPKRDIHDSHADYIIIRINLTSFVIETMQDYDPSIVPVAASVSTLVASTGSWLGAFPSAGSPNTAAGRVSSDGVTDFNLSFGSGNDTWTVRLIASEYGLWIAADNGSNVWVGGSGPVMDVIRGIRDIGFEATATWPVTFAAPTGAQHLTIEVDGVSFNITFRTGVAMTAFDVAQAVTMAIGGLAEGDVVERVAADYVRIRIPEERAPVGNYSTTRPQIKLTYQDPQVVAAGLDFSLYSGAMTAVVTGAGGTLQLNTGAFPQSNVRVGSVVYNHTRGNSAIVQRFGGTLYDTMVMDTVPGTWVAGDAYEVYPFSDHGLAMGGHNGVWQGVLSTDEFATITVGADRVLYLNDIYGEAQGQYEAGQVVSIQNNGMAVVLTVADETGVVLGEEVQNSTTGALGLVRSIDATGNRILVDTTDNSVNPTAIPWNDGDTVVSNGGGTMNTTIAVGGVDSSDTRSTTGWMQFAVVLAVGQVNPGAGDLRTKLTLDLDDPGMNPAAQWFPSAVIGVKAKLRCVALSWQLPSNQWQSDINPRCYAAALYNDDYYDVRRNEANTFVLPSGSQSPHEPDWETHSLQLAELVWGLRGGAAGYDMVGRYPHFRTANARGLVPTIADELDEDGDTNRPWVAVGQLTETMGAHMVSSASHWVCIGPGGVA